MLVTIKHNYYFQSFKTVFFLGIQLKTVLLGAFETSLMFTQLSTLFIWVEIVNKLSYRIIYFKIGN